MRKRAHLFCAFLLLLVPACGLILEEEREVVAEIAGEPIRLKDLLLRIRGLTFEGRALANNPDSEVAVQTRKEILQQLVADRLMILEAEDRGITVSEEEIEQILQDSPAPQDAGDDHTEEVQEGASGQAHEHEHAMHPEWEIEETRNKLLIEKLAAEELSDAAAEEYYLAHFREQFMMNPPMIGYELVAAAPEDKSVVDALHKMATEQRITLFDAYEALGKPSQILEAGITPPMSLDAVVPQMREKIENMERYDVSEPFYFTENGENRYIVVRLVRKMKRKPLRLVRGEIRRILFSQLIGDLEEKFDVQYYYDKLDYRVGE